MAVRDVAYVELYTKDKISTVDHLVSAMGFTRVADSVEVDRSSVLLRQGEVLLVVTSGWGTWKFLDDHGDGIADIAVACEDVPTTRDAALKAGANVTTSPQGNPVVPAFGGVHHTLVPVPARAGDALPAGRRWTPTPGAPAVPGGRVRLLDHIAVHLARDGFADYAAFCHEVFGFSRSSPERLGLGDRVMDSVIVRGASRSAAFVLTTVADGPGFGEPDVFLDRNDGPGVQRLAFLVDDVLSTTREFGELGVRFLHAGSAGDAPAAGLPEDELAALRAADVAVHHDGRGLLMESFSRSPFERETLSFQLVQRLGAQGFGAAGVRAQYDALDEAVNPAR
ncbi:4-hydroxyphenylpyruvate dioxygenase [Streptomyces sp. NBC_00885]|uniref:4-hydroxyphenylpyruvate dioxygenase n=1 Tax=Streptomyces sp. NBC_00885 TaxID=2975857 RepID=UPI003870D547|nr:4-hydroxyphenylpyruvate dioxygenase [Streptomyces sp. NBC_00885]